MVDRAEGNRDPEHQTVIHVEMPSRTESTKSLTDPQELYVVSEVYSGTAKLVAREDGADTVSETRKTVCYVLQKNTAEGVNSGEPQALQLARNLLFIHNDPPYKSVYERWISIREFGFKKLEGKRLRLGFRKNEIYTLVGMYFVFQAALLAFSGTSTKTTCKNRWIPYSLTVCATVAVVFGICQKFFLIHELNDAIRRDYTDYKSAVKNLKALERLGPAFGWSECYGDMKEPKMRDRNDAGTGCIRSLCKKLADIKLPRCIGDRTSKSQFGVCFILLLFGVVFFCAHRSLLPCHGTAPVSSPAP